MKKVDWYKIVFIFSIISLSVNCYMIQDAIRYAVDNIDNNLPNKNDSTIKDTITKYISVPLSSKGNLIYFEGRLQKYNIKISDNYEYDTSFPEEIWKGYVSLARNNLDLAYYIWTKNPLDTSYVKINGYFTNINNATFQHNNSSEYVQMLIPVFSKDFN